MAERPREVIHAVKKQIIESAGTDAFYRQAAVKTRHGRLAIWSSNPNTACTAFWKRTPCYCLCIAHVDEEQLHYAQIEKEALNIVFGIKKFDQYLNGRTFLLVTDHKPLTTLKESKNGNSMLAAARMQRWAPLLSVYQYHTVYRSTTKHPNVDCSSRLPKSRKLICSKVNLCPLKVDLVRKVHDITA